MTYQQVGDERRLIPSRYVRAGAGFGFEVGEYDRSRPLVIDPALMYSSYLGGTNVDEGHAIAVDPAGSAYVAGLAGSTNFPPPGPIQPGGTGGGADAFVLKLDPSGTGLVYATYLGGSGWDEAFGIAVDAQGAAYLAGYTNSTNFPTAGPTATVYGGGFFDGFVSKIDPSGSVLLLSRYLGGSGYDATFAVAVDAHEAPYLTGGPCPPTSRRRRPPSCKRPTAVLATRTSPSSIRRRSTSSTRPIWAAAPGRRDGASRWTWTDSPT
jgi:hypothetical protein